MNWRRNDDYPKTGAPAAVWAWEFLRRNPDYLADWDDYKSRLTKLEKRYRKAAGESPTAILRHALDAGDPLAAIHDPPRRKRETIEQWIKRCRNVTLTPVARWLVNKWGIVGVPLDPSRTYSRVLWKESPKVGLPRITPTRSVDPKNLLIELDLTQSCEAQLKIVQQLFHAERAFLVDNGTIQPRRRVAAAIYRRYLQVLDALVDLGQSEKSKPDKKTIRAIGEALFPHNKNSEPDFPVDAKVRAMIAVARSLRDQDYRLIATHPFLPRNASEK